MSWLMIWGLAPPNFVVIGMVAEKTNESCEFVPCGMLWFIMLPYIGPLVLRSWFHVFWACRLIWTFGPFAPGWCVKGWTPKSDAQVISTLWNRITHRVLNHKLWARSLRFIESWFVLICHYLPVLASIDLIWFVYDQPDSWKFSS